jgi:hypothetical protein
MNPDFSPIRHGEIDVEMILEGTVVVLFVLGLAISIASAMSAIAIRSVVRYVLSIAAPCLYGLVALFVVQLIGGRPVGVLDVIAVGMFFSGLGWSYAWLGARGHF